MNKKFNLAERFKKTEKFDNVTIDDLLNEDVNKSEEVIENTTRKGIVVACNKLNVREKPSLDSKVLMVLENTQEVVIDTTFSHPEFLKVTTALGIEGYCASQYIFIE